MMASDQTASLHFDESGLCENTLQDIELYNELITMARESLLEYHQMLVRALTNSNFQELKTTAHAIKGLALTMHCPEMRMLALEVELSSDQNDLSLSKEKTNPLLEEINVLLEYYLFPKNT
jgi:HPt (histidine-containing phosphotransfer) domain-containing protein